MRYLKLVMICIWALMVACNMQQNSEAVRGVTSKDTLSHNQPVVTVLEFLPDSLQPERILLKDAAAPVTLTIPAAGQGAYTFKDPENNIRRIIPPEITNRPVLQDATGQPVTDQHGNFHYLGEGGTSHMTTYTTDNGLALDNITSSLLDASGNVWFGTWGGGISIFDGTTFTNFSTSHGLSNNLVHCMAEDSTGNIWIGTDGGGVSVYDGYSFRNITTAQGLAGDIVYGITADRKGNMWIATKGGATRYDGTSFFNYNRGNGLPGNSVIKIAEDKKGQIWMATGNNGVTMFDGASFTQFTTEDGLADNEVNCITVDSNGNIWFGTRAGGVSKFQQKSGQGSRGMFTNFTVADGLGYPEIWKIIEDRQGNLWFATGGGGISRYDGKQFTNFTTSQGLPENVVYTLTEDRSGNIWAGTAGGGVTLFHGSAFRIYTMNQGLGANGVYGITEDNAGNLWFGTNGGGVSRYDGKAITNYTPDQGLAHPLVISAFRDSKGRLWFGTGGGGVSLYQESSGGSRNATFTTYNSSSGLQNDVIYVILEDKAGNIWLGTGGGGLVRFDGNIKPVDQAGFTAFTAQQGLAGNTVYSLREDRNGNLWIGTAGGGVSKFDGKSFTNYTTGHGLTSNIVWSILEDNAGKLWFATQGGGVTWFDGTTFSAFTSREGLSDDNVYDLLQDNDGNIIIGTNIGFTVIPEYAAELPAAELKPHLEYYNTATGYPVKDVNKGMFSDSRGNIWAGNGSYRTALVSFDYQKTNKKKQKPDAKIKNISINDNDISWNSLLLKDDLPGKSDSANAFIVEELRKMGKVLSAEERKLLQDEMKSARFSGITRFDNIPENLVLPYAQNNITIEYGTDELARANLAEYKYILEGYNKNWSPAVKKTSATFGNIREGDYTFRVIARYKGPSGEEAKSWSDPVIYRFSVLPPWYRSWWAYLIYGFILLAIIQRVHRFQKARTIRKERERAQQKELEQAKEIERAYAELKSAQSQLIHAEKMASLGELTAGIAHEIQNPLNFVNNFSELSSDLVGEMTEEMGKGDMEEAKAIASDLKVNLEKIHHHGKRAEAIVKGMLQHSRTSTGAKEPVDINGLCDEYLKLAYHGWRAKDKSFSAEFKTSFDPDLPKIEAVPQDIGRVLLNLINNAFYAVDKKSKDLTGLKKDLTGLKKDLTGFENLSGLEREADQLNLTGFKNLSGLEAKRSYALSPFIPTVTVSTRKNGPGIEISVKDNGTGIPEEIKNKIFQPFFTTKPTGQGTGLGLSLSYDIIKAHGGALKVETVEGQGTEFIVQIPIKA